MCKKWVGKVSGGELKRGMIFDLARSGFGVEKGNPRWFKSEQKSDQKIYSKMDGSKSGPKAKKGRCPTRDASVSEAWGGGGRRGKPLLQGSWRRWDSMDVGIRISRRL